jgi:hypothetical protein
VGARPPALERRHDVLALHSAGHAGVRPSRGRPTTRSVDAGRAAWTSAGCRRRRRGSLARRWIALRLAARVRARSVVALAPSGGWAPGDASSRSHLLLQAAMTDENPQASGAHRTLHAAPDGKRLATHHIATISDTSPHELVAHSHARCAAAANCDASLIEHARRRGLDSRRRARRVPVPGRLGHTRGRLLPWTRSACASSADCAPRRWCRSSMSSPICPARSRPARDCPLIPR